MIFFSTRTTTTSSSSTAKATKTTTTTMMILYRFTAFHFGADSQSVGAVPFLHFNFVISFYFCCFADSFGIRIGAFHLRRWIASARSKFINGMFDLTLRRTRAVPRPSSLGDCVEFHLLLFFAQRKERKKKQQQQQNQTHK